MKNLFLSFFLIGSAAQLIAQDPYLFEELNGIIVIESVSAPNYGSWNVDTLISGYTGANYLVYQGSNLYNDPGHSKLTYKVKINKTGTYRVQWRSRISLGNNNTEHNDSWLRINDASSFYAQKSANILFPHGSGLTPNPDGAGKFGWFKVYQNVLNNWTWNTSTNDHNPYSIFATFDSIGIYTIEVSGRSFGHAIDRIVLYHSDVNANQALDLSRPESNKSVLSSIPKEKIDFKIFPNPAVDQIEISIPLSFPAGLSKLKMLDIRGKIVRELKLQPSANERIILSLTDISSGLYFFYLETEDSIYKGKFVKL